MATNKFRGLVKISYPNKLFKGIGRRYTHSKVSCLTPELEFCFNNQINTEFFASFTYLAMVTTRNDVDYFDQSAFFGRQCISLPGCQKYFMSQALDEREHAQKLIDYLNQRGSAVVLQDIKAPTNQTWDSPLCAFKEALELEKTVSQKLFQLHKFSEDCGDQCACNLLENDYLDNQVEEYDKLSRLIAQLEYIGSDGVGIYLFDKYLLKENR